MFLASAGNTQESASVITQEHVLPTINNLAVRKAVKQALNRYKGTVLSVEENAEHYIIKILSEGGTIKMISVANDINAPSVHNQRPITHSSENGTSK